MAFQLKNIQPPKKQQASFDINTLFKKEIRFGASFSTKKKEAFYTELHVLLHAGLPLKDALVLIGEEQRKQKNKNKVAKMATTKTRSTNINPVRRRVTRLQHLPMSKWQKNTKI